MRIINRIISSIVICGALIKPDLVFSQNQKLNILLFTADDLDRNSLGCYGSKVPDISPNLDRFASEGIRFVNAYVIAAICARVAQFSNCLHNLIDEISYDKQIQSIRKDLESWMKQTHDPLLKTKQGFTTYYA